MDPRIERWAKTLVNYCLQVQPGQMVLLVASPVAEPLLAEVYRETLRAGGHPRHADLSTCARGDPAARGE